MKPISRKKRTECITCSSVNSKMSRLLLQRLYQLITMNLNNVFFTLLRARTPVDAHLKLIISMSLNHYTKFTVDQCLGWRAVALHRGVCSSRSCSLSLAMPSSLGLNSNAKMLPAAALPSPRFMGLWRLNCGNGSSQDSPARTPRHRFAVGRVVVTSLLPCLPSSATARYAGLTSPPHPLSAPLHSDPLPPLPYRHRHFLP